MQQTLPRHETRDTFLGRLRRGHPPVPGQVTTLLIALKLIHSELHSAEQLDRALAQSLFLVAYEGRNLFESARAAGADLPPLLDDDLARIAIAAYKIFANEPVTADDNT
ncbi:Dethiobiotin synthetase [cf. Phormidesmis sp. LEGE 11477]|uniref:Dethiobiotin synthetase n=1 Tax=cf. Phormidesmis sp. LEGE 11477 TaxID=1828680 RepID=UPI001D15413B|nr:Dethiobiotin synthetase [cf. Phormidesmis sp. LEGE 11477]